MRNTPKLQDTLEVFLEELEALQIALSNFNEIPEVLDKKIEALKAARIAVDVKDLSALQHSFSTEQSNGMKDQSKLFNQFKVDVEKMLTLKKQNMNAFYWVLLGCLVIVSLSIYFVVNTQMKNNSYAQQIHQLESFNKSMQTYLLESKQVETYNQWLSKEGS